MMTDAAGPSGPAAGKAPVHLWIVGTLALLWTAMGAFDYLATQFQFEPYMSQFTEEQLSYFYGFPAWAVAGWAFGVWGAFVGSVALLLKKRWAVWAYAVSLVGMVVSSLYTLVLTDGMSMMGAGALIFTVIVWLVQIFLLLYAWAMSQRGVLR